MLIQVYQTTGYFTRSILLTHPITEVEVEAFPDDPQEFADRYNGDYLEIGEEDNE